MSKRAGVNGNEDPPVPIPNTEVKLIRVEDTWLETARENRSMPALKPRVFMTLGFVFFFSEFPVFSLIFTALCGIIYGDGVSPSGKAPDFDSGIRRFKSCYPNLTASEPVALQSVFCPPQKYLLLQAVKSFLGAEKIS